MNLKQWLFYGCAASIKNSSGLKKGLKIGGGLMGGGFLVDVLRWAQVVKILPGAGMKISAGSFLKSQRGFFRGVIAQGGGGCNPLCKQYYLLGTV